MPDRKLPTVSSWKKKNKNGPIFQTYQREISDGCGFSHNIDWGTFWSKCIYIWSKFPSIFQQSTAFMVSYLDPTKAYFLSHVHTARQNTKYRWATCMVVAFVGPWCAHLSPWCSWRRGPQNNQTFERWLQNDVPGVVPLCCSIGYYWVLLIVS